MNDLLLLSNFWRGFVPKHRLFLNWDMSVRRILVNRVERFVNVDFIFCWFDIAFKSKTTLTAFECFKLRSKTVVEPGKLATINRILDQLGWLFPVFSGINNLGKARIYCTYELPNFLLDWFRFHIVRIGSVLPVGLTLWHRVEHSVPFFARNGPFEVNHWSVWKLCSN